MRLLRSLLLVCFIISGCSTYSKVVEVTIIEPDRLYEIAFKDKFGRAIIISNASRGVDISVWIEELDPQKDYEITLVRNDGQGVTFGPADNLEIKMGELEGDTILHPNYNGELFVSMLIPERIVTGAEQVRIEISISGENVVLESEPFKFV